MLKFGNKRKFELMEDFVNFYLNIINRIFGEVFFMQEVVEKNYNFKEVEEKVLEEFYGYPILPKFRKPTFSIVIPPPNVTGSLHMGHALNSTIPDFLIRYKLLKGFDAVCFVGTDHAGIATQNVVEKKLLKEGIKRSDLTREEFLQKIWEWKNEYGNIILEQFKRLGLYANINNARFTMDEEYTVAVRKAFVELYNKGYIYKGKRVVNWCPRCLTSLSDLEVVYKPTKTKLYFVRYRIFDRDEYLVVATTRPETIIADTAVAVNPQDQRYTKYIGSQVVVPVVNRLVPVIASEEVDMDFGTGALKITPAHDFNDYKIYQKNKNIEIINVFDQFAKINLSELENKEVLQEFESLDRFEAREKFVQKLEELGLVEKIEDYTTNVGHCYRCDTVIEPFFSDQWFISMRDLVREPRKVVEEEKVRFYPSTYKKVVLDWYDRIEDWCVSRQILWGHRIPVFNCRKCGNQWASEKDENVCPRCKSVDIFQEEDVLDTWFSSALWPFAVMYWPNNFEKYHHYYYPTDVLTTAREIVFLWVSRMIVMSMFFLNEIPFKDVIIHAVILAPSGKRMSKSLGTGIDPLELIEKYGADSVRMGLIIQTAESQDVKFSFEKIEMARNFINKLWNAIRFFQIKKEQRIENRINKDSFQKINSWLIYQLFELMENLERCVEEYRFFDYCMSLYHFVWNVFCDWYIEFSKFVDYKEIEEIVENVIKVILLYLHPIIPFVTYHLFYKLFNQKITEQNLDSLINFVKTKFSYVKEDYEYIQDFVDSVKEVRPFVNDVLQVIKKNVEIRLDSNYFNNDFSNLFFFFTKTSNNSSKQDKFFVIKTKLGDVSIFVDEENIGKFKEIIEKKISDLQKQIEKMEKLLNNQDFVNKADKEVIRNYQENLQKVKEMLNINERILKEI